MNKRAYHIPPSSTECRQCKSYRPDIGCSEISCIQLKAAINDGTVTYRNLLMTIYPQPPTLGWKIQELAGTYLGKLWNDTNHHARFHFLYSRLGPMQCVSPSEGRRFIAALFLCTTSDELNKHTRPCFQTSRIDFTKCHTAKMSREHSFMLYAARCLYERKDEKLILNLGYSYAVYSLNLRVILHGILIAKYGPAVFGLKGDGGF